MFPSAKLLQAGASWNDTWLELTGDDTKKPKYIGSQIAQYLSSLDFENQIAALTTAEPQRPISPHNRSKSPFRASITRFGSVHLSVSPLGHETSAADGQATTLSTRKSLPKVSLVPGSGADQPASATAVPSTTAASSGLNISSMLPASAGVGGAGKGSQPIVGVLGKGDALLTT